MEKRLFFRDPSSGIEIPLQVYRVNTKTVTDLAINKQDTSSNLLATNDKTIVGAINEVSTGMSKMMQKPYNQTIRGGANPAVPQLGRSK